MLPFQNGSTPLVGMTPRSSSESLSQKCDEQEGNRSLEDTVQQAIAAGAYIAFIGRLDHRGENGLKWYYRSQNFERDDQRQAVEQFVLLMDRARENTRVEQEEALQQ